MTFCLLELLFGVILPTALKHIFSGAFNSLRIFPFTAELKRMGPSLFKTRRTIQTVYIEWKKLKQNTLKTEYSYIKINNKTCCGLKSAKSCKRDSVLKLSETDKMCAVTLDMEWRKECYYKKFPKDSTRGASLCPVRCDLPRPSGLILSTLELQE